MEKIVIIGTLFNDASVAEKLKVMSKMDAIFDDSRNEIIPDDIGETIEAFLTLGKTYKITIEEQISPY